MSYKPHTLSCGCCANGCECKMHSRFIPAREQVCEYHYEHDHPRASIGNFFSPMPPEVWEAAMEGRAFTFVWQERRAQ